MALIESLLTLVVLGVWIGAFGTLIGAGGGFLVVPLLILVYGFEPRFAVGTSLVFVFFNALSGSFGYLRQRRIDVRVALMFTAFTVPGAILGAFVTAYLESAIFKIVLSAFLILASVYLVAKPLKEQPDASRGGYHRRLVDREGNAYDYSVNLPRGFAVSLAVGFLSSIFGIGGGIIHVPAMIFLLGFPVHISTATSHLILAFSALVGSATHASLGNVRLDFALPMGVGAIAGAQLGALISRMTKGTVIERLLGLALLIVAVRLLLQVFLS